MQNLDLQSAAGGAGAKELRRTNLWDLRHAVHLRAADGARLSGVNEPRSPMRRIAEIFVSQLGIHLVDPRIVCAEGRTRRTLQSRPVHLYRP